MYKTKDILFFIIIVLFLCLIIIYLEKYNVSENSANVAKCLKLDLELSEEDFLHLRKNDNLNDKKYCLIDRKERVGE